MNASQGSLILIFGSILLCVICLGEYLLPSVGRHSLVYARNSAPSDKCCVTDSIVNNAALIINTNATNDTSWEQFVVGESSTQCIVEEIVEHNVNSINQQCFVEGDQQCFVVCICDDEDIDFAHGETEYVLHRKYSLLFKNLMRHEYIPHIPGPCAMRRKKVVRGGSDWAGYLTGMLLKGIGYLVLGYLAKFCIPNVTGISLYILWSLCCAGLFILNEMGYTSNALNCITYLLALQTSATLFGMISLTVPRFLGGNGIAVHQMPTVLSSSMPGIIATIGLLFVVIVNMYVLGGKGFVGGLLPASTILRGNVLHLSVRLTLWGVVGLGFQHIGSAWLHSSATLLPDTLSNNAANVISSLASSTYVQMVLNSDITRVAIRNVCCSIGLRLCWIVLALFIRSFVKSPCRTIVGCVVVYAGPLVCFHSISGWYSTYLGYSVRGVVETLSSSVLSYYFINYICKIKRRSSLASDLGPTQAEPGLQSTKAKQSCSPTRRGGGGVGIKSVLTRFLCILPFLPGGFAAGGSAGMNVVSSMIPPGGVVGTLAGAGAALMNDMVAERNDVNSLLSNIFQGNDVGEDDDDYTPAADTTDASSSANSNPHIMTTELFIPQDQVNLRQKYGHLTHPTVKLVWNAFDTLTGFLLRIGTESPATPEEIEQAFQKFADDFIAIYPSTGNLGQKLDGKGYAYIMCFAINASIGYKDGTASYDRMLIINCCVSWMIRHTFRSILLDGKTDSSTFTTDLAAALFSQHITLLDFITVCCKGTTACPEGNKWPVMKKQLETHGTTFGLDDADRMPFWWLVGSINIGFRALYFHAKSGGKPFTIMNASIRNMREGHNNQDGNILKSKVLVVYNGPHAQASQSSLANKAVHPPAMIQMYTEHATAFLKFLDGLVFEEIEIKVPGVNDLLYYLRRAKMNGLTETPEEAAARREALLVLYAIPHLAAVLAVALKDKDLSSLTIDTMIDEDTFSNPLDWKAYNELLRRLTKAEVVRKLKARREKQLSNVWNQLKHIAAVIVKGGNNISELRSRALKSFTFEAADEIIFKALTARFGNGAPLLRLLQDARKQWDKSKLKELIDLKHIAAEIVKGGNDIFDLTSFEGITFEGDDKKTFERLTAKFDTAELLRKLQDARVDLKHIAAVIVDGGNDIFKLTSFNGITFKGEDKKIFERLTAKFGNGAALVRKLQDARKQYEESVIKESNDLSRIAALIVDGGNDIFKLTSLEGITFAGEDKDTFESLSAKFGNGAALVRKLQDARKQWDESKLKELIDLKHIAAEIVKGGNDIFKLTSLEGITFKGDDKDTFNELTIKFGNELLGKFQDARRQCLKQWDECPLKESNYLKTIEALLSDQYDILSLTTLAGINFEGRAAESIESLRLTYSNGVILEKVKEFHRRKGEETLTFTFDMSKVEDGYLGFFFGESKSGDELLVTDIDLEGPGKKAGLWEGAVVKSVNKDLWRGRGDYNRMIEWMLEATKGEKVVLEVFPMHSYKRQRV